MAGDNCSAEFSFQLMHNPDLFATIIVILLLLIWGVAYMSFINSRLFVFFNETVFNYLLGIALGLALGSSGPLKRVTSFFLPWDNFENNILPFMIIYPASKLCAEYTRKQFGLIIVYAILSGFICVALNSCSFIAYLATQPASYFLTEERLNFRHVLFAIHLSACVSIYDAYLCVHNFPEVRGNSHIRGFLSSQGLIAMSFALELRQLSLELTGHASLSIQHAAEAALKRALFVPLTSIVLGTSAGLVSSYVTKHSSFLHVQQEMVVLPCANYIAYTVAQTAGLSPIVTSITCEVIQGNYSINNVSEASKITYKSMLAKSSKMLGFLATLSFGFFFGSFENRFLWKYVCMKMFAIFLGITIVARVFSSLLAYWCVKRLGLHMRNNMMLLQVLIHTRATPSLMSLINLHHHSQVFNVCLPNLLIVQWTLYVMVMFVNMINVPLVGLLFKRLKIEPDTSDHQAEPIFHVIFRLMYHELNQQIEYLSGGHRSCEFITMLHHVKKSFVRYVMSLGFMSVPERKSLILSAYDQTITQRSNVIDQRRKSVKSKNRIYATQVCASFIVRNLGFEGFQTDDIAEYFLVG